MFAVELRQVTAEGPRLVELAWAPSLGLSLSFALDGLGLVFALLITVIGALVVLYASSYLEAHPQANRFHAFLLAFMGSMLGLVLSDNILALFVFWELTGFTSFLLIGFDHEREEARSAALQALMVTGAGGLALLAAGVLLVEFSGTTSLAAMSAHAGTIVSHRSYLLVAVLTLLAAFTKSAQFPFHFWLPRAMAAPTPASAYLHSATMVKAGVYLLARMTPILGGTPEWTTLVTGVGAVTMVLGACRSVQETDLKRLLAYSTISALGVLTMLLGLGTHTAVVAALVYLVAHACYKGALFLVVGIIDHETGSRDITALAGLRQALPITAVAGGAAALSMAGIPLTVGFIGKDAAYEAVLGAGAWSSWLTGLTVIASSLLGLAGLIAGVRPFLGTIDTTRQPREHWPLWLPPLVLASVGLIVGLLPWLLNAPLSAAATNSLGDRTLVSLAVWHGFTPALLLSALTLLALWGAYTTRDAIRARTWLPAFGAERLYAGALAALDATARAIAPPLQSASLRSYVMVIVLTTALLGVGVVATGPGFGGIVPDTGVRPHDVFVILVIITGAIAAVLARSTMAAVLALGTVGYGVAMTFLLFGAPDLAMTQFSVETLTVLIYVLVFRHFRNLGALSRPLVRTRDAIVAAGVGTLVGGVALIVATTDTAPALREFFVTNGPTLGHGRNIVNVILVDFRAFDTLGEVTVLATAAIGVHALLRLTGGPDELRQAAGGDTPAQSLEQHGPPDAPSDALATPPSAIFRAATRALMPLLLLFSLFLLLRGHNQPGGGFVGGLIAGAAYALYAMAYGPERARRALLVEPRTLLGVGLLLALASSAAAPVVGRPYLSSLWVLEPVALGTPVVFDVGVCLVVTGVVSMMIASLIEER
ncbi:hydrogen gas-evolving membrane-bound hydrogenase subunit E [Luteitalea sp.]